VFNDIAACWWRDGFADRAREKWKKEGTGLLQRIYENNDSVRTDCVTRGNKRQPVTVARNRNRKNK
jgi:hypothetical protein